MSPNLRPRSLVAPVIALLLASSAAGDARAKLQIKEPAGSSGGVAKLTTMLQTGVGEGVTVQVAGNGNVTLTGNPGNKFSERLKMIVDDPRDVCVTVSEEDTFGGHAIFGAFNREKRGNARLGPGNGKQTIDVTDLEQLPTSPGPGIATQQSHLIHELVEAWAGLGPLPGSGQNPMPRNFQQAHRIGLEAEAEILEDQHGMPWRRTPFDPPFPKAPGQRLRQLFSKRDANGKPRIRESSWVTDANWGLTNRRSRQIAALDRTYADGCSEGLLCSFDQTDSTEVLTPLADLVEAGVFFSYVISDRSDNLFLAAPFDDHVVRTTTSGQLLQFFSHPQLQLPQGLAYDVVDDELFVASEGIDGVVVFAGNGTYQRHFSPSGLSMPAGLALDSEGDLFIANVAGNSILHVDPSGVVLNQFSDPELQDPAGLAFAITGELYVASTVNEKIVVFDADGTFNRVLAAGNIPLPSTKRSTCGASPVLASPFGVAVDAPGTVGLYAPGNAEGVLSRIFVTSAGGTAILAISPEGEAVDCLSDPAVGVPNLVAHLTEITESLLPNDAPEAASARRPQLGSNTPNPFNPSTTIRFEIPGPGAASARLAVFDAAGRHVVTLLRGLVPAGTGQVTWDGRNQAGDPASSGVYFAHLEVTGHPTVQRKMALVK